MEHLQLKKMTDNQMFRANKRFNKLKKTLHFTVTDSGAVLHAGLALSDLTWFTGWTVGSAVGRWCDQNRLAGPRPSLLDKPDDSKRVIDSHQPGRRILPV